MPDPARPGMGGGGIGTIIVLVIIYLLFIKGGGGSGGFDVPEPSSAFPQVPQSGHWQRSVPGSPDEEKEKQFVDFVSGDAQELLAPAVPGGRQALPAGARWSSSAARPTRAAGSPSSATGPFYCPLDQKVYLDLGFFDELSSASRRPATSPQAYVIAHEIGHHVQQQLGIEQKVRQQSQQNPGDANELSVRLELQADCLAGVWARSTYDRGILESGDLQEGLTRRGGGRRRPDPAADAGPDRPRDVHPRHLRAARALAADRLRLGQARVLRHVLRRHLATKEPRIQ